MFALGKTILGELWEIEDSILVLIVLIEDSLAIFQGERDNRFRSRLQDTVKILARD